MQAPTATLVMAFVGVFLPRGSAGAPLPAAVRQRAALIATGEDPSDLRIGEGGTLRFGDLGVTALKVLPPSRPALLDNRVLWVDRATGAFLMAENRIYARDRVNVFPANPVVTPKTEERLLTGLDDPREDGKLHGPLLAAFNCPDRRELTEITLPSLGLRLPVHLCTEEQMATADAEGDYLYDGSDPTDPEDLFAEAHVFYHASRAYEFFQGLGFDRLRQVPIRVVCNFRIPNLTDFLSIGDPNSDLVPFDNAFFLPGESLEGILAREDSIVFGQGTSVDFAYDGDVIYHEFAHAVVDTLARLQSIRLDSHGASAEPGSLHEGYADYFSSALSGDPTVGEYVSGAFGGDALRDLRSLATCPADILGEPHNDSLPFSGTLWATRTALVEAGADARAVDRAVLDAVADLPPDAGFAEAIAVTAARLDGAMGEAAARVLWTEAALRGVADCTRVRPARLPLERPETVLVPGRGSVGLSPFVPGYVQYALEPGPGDEWVSIEFDVAPSVLPIEIPGLGGGPSDPVVLLRRGEPVTLAYRQEVDGSVRVEARDATLVESGYRADPRPGEPEERFVEFAVPDGEGPLHVLFANRGSGDATLTLRAFEVGRRPSGAGADAGADAGGGGKDAGAPVGGADAGGGAPEVNGPEDAGNRDAGLATGGRDDGKVSLRGGDADSPAVAATPEAGEGGCGCRVAGGGAGAGPALLLGVLLGMCHRSRRKGNLALR